jgi:hypothetical protein
MRVDAPRGFNREFVRVMIHGNRSVLSRFSKIDSPSLTRVYFVRFRIRAAKSRPR